MELFKTNCTPWNALFDVEYINKVFHPTTEYAFHQLRYFETFNQDRRKFYFRYLYHNRLYCWLSGAILVEAYGR